MYPKEEIEMLNSINARNKIIYNLTENQLYTLKYKYYHDIGEYIRVEHPKMFAEVMERLKTGSTIGVNKYGYGLKEGNKTKAGFEIYVWRQN